MSVVDIKLVTPSKWDIIPIHTSDRATFKDCRRRWYWSSPAMQNLIPKTSINGIYFPFWFGTGIHWSVERSYDPILKEDPESVFDAWYHLQVNGGEVHEDELEMFADRTPIYNANTNTWTVRGLTEILPFDQSEELEEHHQVGLGMMRYYKDYAEREDDFTVISLEHTFSVPILDPTGAPLYMVDTRPMPEGWEPNLTEGNIYGPLMRELDYDMGDRYEKQVHARGRTDMVVQGNNTGNYAIFDHKTAGKALDESYFDHVDLDEQCTTYLWTSEMEAKMYDLEYTEMAGIVYQALRKAYPTPPTITTRNLPSLNRAEEHTNPQLFEAAVKELGLETWLATDVKAQQYYTYLVENGDKQYIMRKDVKRSKIQKDNAALRIYMEAMDMLSNPYIYPNPKKEWSCLKCAFRAPCIATEKGYDYEDMLNDGFETNHDR